MMLRVVMPAKKYRVTLSSDERAHLLERIGRGERPAREQTRARILLKVDEGPDGPSWSDARAAQALEVAEGTVAALRHRFVERGLRGAVSSTKPRTAITAGSSTASRRRG